MYLLTKESVDCCICNIFLENVSREFNRELKTFFCSDNTCSIVLKELNNFYLPEEEKCFVWISGLVLDFQCSEVILQILKENTNVKIIFINNIKLESSEDKIEVQERLLLELNSYKNFNEIKGDYFSSSMTAYKFIEKKGYCSELLPRMKKMAEIAELIIDKKVSLLSSYFNLYFQDMGYYNFKETFLFCKVPQKLKGKLQLLYNRKKRLLEKLISKKSLQTNDSCVMCLSEYDIHDVLFLEYNRNIINFYDKDKICIYLSESNDDFFEEIKLMKYFGKDIYNTYSNEKYHLIELKEKILYTNALNLIKYLFTELS